MKHSCARRAREQVGRDVQHQRAREAWQHAVLLRVERAAHDGEEVARQALEDRPVLRDHQALVGSGRQVGIGIRGGADEAGVLRVRVVAAHRNGHAPGAFAIEGIGKGREGLDGDEQARRRPGEAHPRFRVAGRGERIPERRADGLVRQASRAALQPCGSVEPPHMVRQMVDAGASVRPERAVGPGRQQCRSVADLLERTRDDLKRPHNLSIFNDNERCRKEVDSRRLNPVPWMWGGFM